MAAALGGPTHAWVGILRESGDPVGIGRRSDDWMHRGSIVGGCFWPAADLFRFMPVFSAVLRLPVPVRGQLWRVVPCPGRHHLFYDGGFLRLVAALPAGTISDSSASDGA